MENRTGDAPAGGSAPPQDQDLSDDERLRLGAQQAAMIQLQAVKDIEMREKALHQQRLLEEDNQRKLIEAQQQAFASAMVEQQQQRQIAEQQRIQQMQLQAVAESQKEEELKHLQMMALAEKEQEKQLQLHQHIPPLQGSGGVPLASGPPPPGPITAPVNPQAVVSQSLPPPQPLLVPSLATTSQQSMPSFMSMAAPRPPIPPPAAVPPPVSQQQQPPQQPPPPSSVVMQIPMSAPAPVAVSSPAVVSQADAAAGSGSAPGLLGAPPSSQQAQTTSVGDKPRPLMSIDTQPPPRKLTDDEGEEGGEFKLPQALEKVLAFKDVRAQQVGLKPEDVDKVEQEAYADEDEVAPGDWGADEYDEDDDDELPKVVPLKDSKNRRKKKKKKKAKQRKILQPFPKTEPELSEEEKVDVVYVSENLELPITDPSFREFSKIFDKFKIVDMEKEKEREEEERKRLEEKEKAERPSMKVKNVLSDEELEEDDDDMPLESDGPKLSKKKLKKLNRLSVAELKQLVSRPDVVEMHDVTARDPKLLVSLKATRNSVTVPRHWCFKRKYLQGKRGIEKTPFQLPSFIRDTGIEDMRAALQEKEDQKNLKARMRERVRPKMGKIDIDYQKLHDAFFRYQTKPKMTIHGDLYYEGKEFETRLKEKKPGNLSDELRTALGMPLGPNAEKYPPPWLIAMQRYGPPPSYPNLKIPGLNGPIPESCAFGYHAGGWGKPPVDESGKPLYGDVFGVQTSAEEATVVEDDDIDKSRWGQLESDSEEEEEDDDDDDEDEDGEMEEPDATGLVTPGDPGLVTPSGVTSVPVGVETPDLIELRKKRIEDSMDQGGDTPALYTVLPEKKVNVAAGAMMGSAHVYDVTGALAGSTAQAAAAAAAGKKASDQDGIELALNPDELDLDSAAIQAKYDQQMREQQSHLAKEDLSDMVAEHTAKQKKRKKQQDSQQGKAAKKYKDFKF